MRTILVTVLFFLAISAAAYCGFVAYMAEQYDVSWEVMSETVNEIMLASPQKTSILIIVVGVLSYWATWFSFGSKRRK